MRVLLVEDSTRLQTSVGRGLRKAGYAVDITGNGEEGLWLAQSNEYDVIILDLMIPGLDGLSLLARLREEGRSTHVLILTARSSVHDRISGLHMGADDYLVKPFAFDELLARVQALCRRAYRLKNPVIRIGDLRINTSAWTVSRDNEVIKLTAREYKLLEYLALRQGDVVTRNEIESHIYSDSAELMSNTVDSAICTLRRKLSAGKHDSIIRTRRGAGYIIEKEGHGLDSTAS